MSIVFRNPRAAPYLTLAGGRGRRRRHSRRDRAAARDQVAERRRRPAPRTAARAGASSPASSPKRRRRPTGCSTWCSASASTSAPAAYPPEIADRASSIEAELGRRSTLARFCVEVLAALARQVSTTDRRSIVDALLRAVARAGADRLRRVRSSAKRPRGRVAGVAAGIADDGALLVRVGDAHRANRSRARSSGDEMTSLRPCCSRSTSATPTSCSASSTANGSPELAPADAARADRRRDRHPRHAPVRASAASIARGIDGIIISSVVPPLTGTMEEMAERYFGTTPLTVDPATNTGMRVLYTPPSDVGADRVVNAVAAYEMFGRAERRPGDRRGLRHGDDVRRDFGGRRVPRRRDLSGHRHLGRRAVPARGAAAARRRSQAAVDHRADDGHVDAGRALLRLRVDGGRHRASASARSCRRATRAPASPPAAWPACCRTRRRPFSASSRT